MQGGGEYGRSSLIVASNRGPLSVSVDDEGNEQIRRGSGGLVTGIETALRSSPDAVWICAPMGVVERTIARRAAGGRWSETAIAPDVLGGDFDVVMVEIDEYTFRQAYDSVANSTLWFMLHMLFEPTNRPAFDATWRRQWAAYTRVNLAFAQAIARQAAHGATVMVQDYHLFLVARMLREARPDLRIGLFTHTPWVPPDYFRVLPDDVARSILEGMLEADLVGFHTQRWADLFDTCCQSILGRPAASRTGVFALSVDGDSIRARANRRDVDAAVADLRESVDGRTVIGRVDRTELSKNVLRGLLAYRELLRRWPQWHGRVVHVVADFPSRGAIRQYRDYIEQVVDLARSIDDEFATDEWQPLIISTEVEYAQALAALRLSDVVFVNSLRDGMNLVVLEAIAVADGDPVVVLSREAGAADLLGDAALLVNPFDISQTAEALHTALTMSKDEREERAERLRERYARSGPQEWFQAQVDVLGQVPPDAVTG